MAKLYFRYGAMGSSKTANALMVKYNYEERGQKVLIAKPAIDTRDGEKVIKSRCGLSSPCVIFDEITENTVKGYSCLIVDEAQFLSKEQVNFIIHLVDDLNIPVVCYGLRADFKGNLFEGSAALLAAADTIEEIKTICWCGKKATYNARFNKNGEVVKNGAQVVLGANDKYIGLCRKHWSEVNLGVQKTEA